MTQRDTESYALKRQSGEKIDPRITEAINEGAEEGEFTCLMAEDTVKRLRVTMAQTGAALDLMGVRLSRCQLGLFGFTPESRIVKPEPNVRSDMEEAIRKALVDGCLPCRAAWTIATSLDLPRMDVSSACEALKIRIKPCQLGVF